MSETELIEQVRAGNYQAFERLVKQYHTAAFRIALSFTGNRDIAMDLSQEAFIRVFRHRGELDPR
nr:sigma factor [Calditrichia bacterium]